MPKSKSTPANGGPSGEKRTLIKSWFSSRKPSCGAAKTPQGDKPNVEGMQGKNAEAGKGIDDGEGEVEIKKKYRPSLLTRKSTGTSSRRVASLSRLIERSDWKQIRDALRDQGGDPGEAANRRKIVEECTDFTGRSALHAVLQCHPPLDVVEYIIDASPNLPSAVDCMGRLPLHHAASFGASPQVVSCLVSANLSAAGAKDCCDKSPLHLLCENLTRTSHKNARNQSKKKKHPKATVLSDTGNRFGDKIHGPTFGAASTLVRACPEMVNDEDKDGFSPLDYAVNGEADLAVIKILQKVSSIEWKYRKESSQGEGGRGRQALLDEVSWAIREVQDREKKKRYARIKQEEHLLEERLADFLGTSPPGSNRREGKGNRWKDERNREKDEVRNRRSLTDLPIEVAIGPDWNIEEDDVSVLTCCSLKGVDDASFVEGGSPPSVSQQIPIDPLCS